MAKIRIEISMISARGLRQSSILKPHWFAVGWLDPIDKYCTKIDTSGSSTPTWQTKFSFIADETKMNADGLLLTVEVYRRDPIFLREKLQGTATVKLKEFMAKFQQDRDASGSGIEETGGFQLRKNKSAKPQGYIDLSISIYEDSYSAKDGGDDIQGINLAIEDGPVLTYPTKTEAPATSHQFNNYNQVSYPYSQPMPPPRSYYTQMQPNNLPNMVPSYPRHSTPPPPPPPSNTGFLPAIFPGSSHLPDNRGNMPTSGYGGQNSQPGFGMGLGAGALAAGAVLFGDDFMPEPTLTSS